MPLEGALYLEGVGDGPCWALSYDSLQDKGQPKESRGLPA